MSFSLAIDGPAGAGKSTIAKKIAKKMGLIYIDTGAMYRAMAYFLLEQNIEVTDTKKIEEVCELAEIKIDYVDKEQVVLLNKKNVTPYLRREEVGKMASISSGNLKVRKKLVALQQELAKSVDIVMDGRDIGTCVLPNATVKIYLTATSEVRAKRRYNELISSGENPDCAEIQKDIEERDFRDMHREHSPLKQAKDAILVDTSHDSIDEVVEKIIQLCK